LLLVAGSVAGSGGDDGLNRLSAGSPFLVAIGGEPSGRVTERIVRQKEAADITHIGSQCELSLKIPGTRCRFRLSDS